MVRIVVMTTADEEAFRRAERRRTVRLVTRELSAALNSSRLGRLSSGGIGEGARWAINS